MSPASPLPATARINALFINHRAFDTFRVVILATYISPAKQSSSTRLLKAVRRTEGARRGPFLLPPFAARRWRRDKQITARSPALCLPNARPRDRSNCARDKGNEIHGQNLINLFMQRRSSRSNCKSAKFNWIVYRRRSSGLGIEINATTPALASIPPRPCLAPQSSCVASRRLSSRSRSDIRRLSSHAVSLSNSLPQKDTRAPSPSPRGRHRFSHDSRAPTIKQSECALRSTKGFPSDVFPPLPSARLVPLTARIRSYRFTVCRARTN